MNNKGNFGVWMDTLHATIVGSKADDPGNLTVITHVLGEETSLQGSEKTKNNERIMLQSKFFKQITSHLQNATLVHATGTGQVQEQFIRYLADTPQFKNTKTEESTSTPMSDEKLLSFFSDKLK